MANNSEYNGPETRRKKVLTMSVANICTHYYGSLGPDVVNQLPDTYKLSKIIFFTYAHHNASFKLHGIDTLNPTTFFNDRTQTMCIPITAYGLNVTVIFTRNDTYSSVLFTTEEPTAVRNYRLPDDLPVYLFPNQIHSLVLHFTEFFEKFLNAILHKTRIKNTPRANITTAKIADPPVVPNIGDDDPAIRAEAERQRIRIAVGRIRATITEKSETERLKLNAIYQKLARENAASAGTAAGNHMQCGLNQGYGGAAG